MKQQSPLSGKGNEKAKQTLTPVIALREVALHVGIDAGRTDAF